MAALRCEWRRSGSPGVEARGDARLWLYSAASWVGGGGGINKWERRFLRVRDQLLYYRREEDSKPRRAIKRRVLVDEGAKRTKTRGAFRVLSLYLRHAREHAAPARAP